jgi:hypothetical protein
MFVNYKINTKDYNGVSGTTINIPINIKYQIVDTNETVQRVFVDEEVKKSINCILDYEKTRFKPLDMSDNVINEITYNINVLSKNGTYIKPTYYKDVQIDDLDLKFLKNSLKNSFLLLQFYDNTNPLIQNFVTEIQIYNNLYPENYYPYSNPPKPTDGQVKPANEVQLKYLISNPEIFSNGFFSGFYLYDYIDSYMDDKPKSLYMKASFFNAKTGRVINLMTSTDKLPINQLFDKLYTKYDLSKNDNGYFYKIDNNFSNNIIYNGTSKKIIIDLYEINAK